MMTKNSTQFFATSSDLVTLFASALPEYPLKFVLSGLFDSTSIQSFDSIAPHMTGVSYLIADCTLAINVRPVPQRNGGIKYAVDQISNPQTVVLQVGGMIDEDKLIAGQIGTATAEPKSLTLFGTLAEAMQSQFEHIKSFYVGPEAARKLDGGVRLSPTRKSPVSYDLIRS